MQAQKSFAPMGIAVDAAGKHQLFFLAGFQGQEQAEFARNVTQAVRKLVKPVRWIFVSEAWAALQSMKEPLTPARDHPEKFEVLSVVVKEASREASAYSRIIRQGEALSFGETHITIGGPEDFYDPLWKEMFL